MGIELLSHRMRFFCQEKVNAPLEDHEFLPLDHRKFPVERYKPISIVGSGAAGTVYLCLDVLLSKYVAVKTLNINQPEALIAFQSEAKALSLLNHPNIVTLLDFGIVKNSAPYMVLEYLPGSSLMSVLEKDGTLTIGKSLQLFSQAAIFFNTIYYLYSGLLSLCVSLNILMTSTNS